MSTGSLPANGAIASIGLIGLGRMGRPIALNLARSGLPLVVASAGGRSFAEFRAHGVETTTDPVRVAAAELVFLCLPDAQAVRAVVFGDAGLAASMRPGQTLVDLGTTSHAATLEFAGRLAERGVAFMDAPVSGMEARAVDATLTVMCGASPETFERVRPLLERIGNRVLRIGEVGSGQLAKLVNQLLFDINAAALAELLPMAVALGLDAALVAEVVNSGTGASHASTFFLPRILGRRFGDGYPLANAYKDLVEGATLGAAHCIPMPVLAAATATYQAAMRRGHGADDKGAMVKVYEELLGVTVQANGDPQ